MRKLVLGLILALGVTLIPMAAAQADTVSDERAADLCFAADCGSFSFAGDDERACRFAPPGFGCPETVLAVPADAVTTLKPGLSLWDAVTRSAARTAS